jgi:hypothetical protein
MLIEKRDRRLLLMERKMKQKWYHLCYAVICLLLWMHAVRILPLLGVVTSELVDWGIFLVILLFIAAYSFYFYRECGAQFGRIKEWIKEKEYITLGIVAFLLIATQIFYIGF